MSRAPMFRIEERDSSDPDWWHAAMESRSPALLGYHHPAYQRLLGEVLKDQGRVLLARGADGRIAACLPYRQRSGRHGTIVNAMPFFGTNGAVVGSDPLAIDALLASLAERIRQPEVLASAFYTPFLADPEPLGAILPVGQRLAKFTHYLDLEGHAGWPVKRRGDLRRAHAAGLSVRDPRDADAPVLWDIYESTAAEAGIPLKPRQWFDGTFELAGRLGRAGPVRWLVAEHRGEAVGGLLSMRGPVTGSYTLPLARTEIRAHQPVALLIDAAITGGRAEGMRYYNFESSPRWDDPVARFKERWGATADRYELILSYPRGEAAVAALPPDVLRQEYPFYFARPWGEVGGLWPIQIQADTVADRTDRP